MSTDEAKSWEEIGEGDNGKRFALFAGGWSPGDRRIDVETGPDIIH